jgi:hypothetical protein
MEVERAVDGRATPSSCHGRLTVDEAAPRAFFFLTQFVDDLMAPKHHHIRLYDEHDHGGRSFSAVSFFPN